MKTKKYFELLFIFYCFSPLWSLRPEITVVTMALGEKYQEAVKKAIENKRGYSEKYGYGFVYGKEILDVSRPLAWNKILLILRVMNTSDCQWIFWSDADSLIMNPEICLENIIDNEYNFILTRDLNALNTGQFLIKNCEWSRDFLNAVYNQTDCIYHPWWENQAVIQLLESNPEYLSLTKILLQRVMNSYAVEIIGNKEGHTFQPEDFIVHFAGVRSLETLTYLIDKYGQMINDANLSPRYRFRSPRYRFRYFSNKRLPKIRAFSYM